MKAFDVKALYEKYCQKESDHQYYCVKDCRTYRIIPAAEAELTAFRANCIARNVPEETTEELLAYTRCDTPGRPLSEACLQASRIL